MTSPPLDQIHAVLMGDIVGSESATSVERLHDIFNDTIDRSNRARHDVLASPLTITLGDEFQGLTSTLRDAAALARDIRLELLVERFDCRFAIGVAKLETPLNADRAWNMMAPGLARTREKLNEKRTNTLYRFSFPEHPAVETLLEALGAGLTSIERRWTMQQLHDISESLRGRTPAEIARRRNVSAHSVYKVRSTGEFELYHLQWHAMIEALGVLDLQYAPR